MGVSVADVTVSERVLEIREWEVHHLRWLLHSMVMNTRSFASQIQAMHEWSAAEALASLKAEQDGLWAEFERRRAALMGMTADEIRHDRSAIRAG